MDHLPLPQNPMDLIKVPLLSTIDYDGGDVGTYPERQGWGSRTVMEWQYLFERPPPEFAAFLQRWLYFGFLETIFDTHINVLSSFVSTDSPEDYPILTSEHILGLARRFLSKDFSKRVITEERVLHVFKAINVVGVMHQCLNMGGGRKRTGEYIYAQETLMKFIATEQPKDPRDARIVIAITLLMEFVGECMQFTLWEVQSDQGVPKLEEVRSDGGRRPFRVDGGALQKGFRSPIWKILRQKGWCPSQLQPMFSEFSSAGLLYMNNMERPSPGESHQMIFIRGEMNHKENRLPGPFSTDNLCKPHQCPFRQLSDSTYQTKHTENCPGCVDMVADLDVLCEILEGGGIPLIQVIDSRWEDENIKLIEAEPGMAYVAISHVWSDGLGNVARNALCRCQLLRLSELIGDLPEPAENIVCFWLDTICVPPDAAKRENAQLKALEMMRQTYEKATAVLVLDSWLLSCTSQGKSDTEILMRIFNSLWNRRLWTYQEGALARLLLFQFRDRAYELDAAMERLIHDTDLALTFTLKSSLVSRFNSLRCFRESTRSLTERLDAVFAALRFRATSVASDEALCLSALMGFDIQRIARTPPNSRMEEFWRLNSSIPASVLFYSGATLNTKGFRWAPQTLLLSETNFSRSTGTYSEVDNTSALDPVAAKSTSRGLLVELPGFVCRIGKHPIGSNFSVKDQYGKYFQMGLQLKASSPKTKAFMEDQNGTFMEALSVNPSDVYGSEEVAFVSRYDVRRENGKREMEKLAENSQILALGILAAVIDEKDEIVYVEKICNVTCTILNPYNHGTTIDTIESAYPGQQPYGSPVKVDKRTRVALACIADTKPSKQQWCVD